MKSLKLNIILSIFALISIFSTGCSEPELMEFERPDLIYSPTFNNFHIDNSVNWDITANGDVLMNGDKIVNHGDTITNIINGNQYILSGTFLGNVELTHIETGDIFVEICNNCDEGGQDTLLVTRYDTVHNVIRDTINVVHSKDKEVLVLGGHKSDYYRQNHRESKANKQIAKSRSLNVKTGGDFAYFFPIDPENGQYGAVISQEISCDGIANLAVVAGEDTMHVEITTESQWGTKLCDNLVSSTGQNKVVGQVYRYQIVSWAPGISPTIPMNGTWKFGSHATNVDVLFPNGIRFNQEVPIVGFYQVDKELYLQGAYNAFDIATNTMKTLN